MDVESNLDRVFERSASGVRPDVPSALREVRIRARRRTARRRLAVAATVVGVLAAAGVTATLLGPDPDATQTPVSPPRERSASPVTVVGEVSAADLGLRKLLSAAVGPDGRVYVTDTSQQVAELTPDLELVRTWGASGAGRGRFRLVQGSIAVGPDGSVYVSDTGNFRIQVFTPDGEFVRSIGEFGNGPGQFTWPFDIAVDAKGDIYAADDKEQTLAKLSPDGKQLWRRGGIRETDPRLQGHLHLTMFDERGRLVVTNDDQGVVLFVASDGSVAGTFGGVDFEPGDTCDTTLADRLFYLTTCGPPFPLHVYGTDGAPVGEPLDLGLVQSPRWTDGGIGYAVTDEGGIVELRAD